MEKPQAQRLLPSILLGLVFMAFGMLLLLHNMDILAIGRSLRFWPTITLIPWSLERFFSKGILESLGGHLILLAGVTAQTLCLGHTDHFLRWWPVGLLWIGLVITLKALYGQNKTTRDAKAKDTDGRNL